MGLFRKKTRPEAETIAEFWQWWGTTRDGVAEAISSGAVQGFATPISERVEAINKDLQWELTPGGDTSRHALVVTAAGQAPLRATAARWLAAAPPPDATWSYRSTRLADPHVFESSMVIGDQKIELAELRYGITVDKERRTIDVSGYHPAFAGMPDNMRGQITYLSLDWAVGEDNVEIWISEVGWSTTEPANPKTPQDLRYAVDALATDEDSWVLMQGQRPDGTVVMAMATSPLRSARWPRFDRHVPIALPYQTCNDGLLPINESLEALRAFEDELTYAIGNNGTMVAHETSGRLRILHFYVDSQTNARAELESHLPRWREGRAHAESDYDPGFDNVRHLMR